MTCAVCDNDHTTQRLCARCRDDPANADWVEVWRGIEDRVDPGADAEHVHWHRKGAYDQDAPRTLAEHQQRRLKPPTSREVAIVELSVIGYLIPVARRTKAGRSRGVVMRRIALTQREVAHMVGCRQGHVLRTYRKYGVY